jgi:hypothetical protein
MPTLTDAQLLAEVEDLIRTMPSRERLGNDDADTLAWVGRASALAHAWDPVRATLAFDMHARNLGATASATYSQAARGVISGLHQIRHELRLRTVGPLTVAVPTGGVFDYFDEVRKVIAEARSDLLFVDPYLDAEFVSRYLPHVCQGTTVRLLARERLPSLLAAVPPARTQLNLTIEVRSAAAFHDRYIFIDFCSCYQSGASFKDGAKKAPTTLTQITDAFKAVSSTYEQLWASGTPHP